MKMKKNLKPESRDELKDLVEYEIIKCGHQCNLNHIDVSNVKDMTGIFYNSSFNGDISQWNVSNVEDMAQMFYHSSFNGNISNWDVSNVINMRNMFSFSKFNTDINKWKVNNVKNMTEMFEGAKYGSPKNMFDKSEIASLKSWRPNSLLKNKNCFLHSKIKELPYWSEFTEEDLEFGAMSIYLSKIDLHEKLNKILPNGEIMVKKLKI